MDAHAPANGVTRPAAPPAAVQAGVLLGLLAAIYHRAAAELWHVWTTNDNYSHGMLVPLTSAVLVWSRRDALRSLPMRPDARGLLLVLLGCVMLVLGVRASVFAFQGWSILPMLFGLTLAFLGPAFTRALAFPIGYLAFMLTFPSFVTNQLSFALKSITLKLSIVAAETLGVSLHRVGMTVFLETGELRIENPCSGLRSLLALLALGALFAHLQPGGWRRRLLLFALAVPIALLGNAIRTTLLLVAGHYVNVEFAAGRFHDLSGYVVYAVALVLLFAARALLRPRAPEVPAGTATVAGGAA